MAPGMWRWKFKHFRDFERVFAQCSFARARFVMLMRSLIHPSGGVRLQAWLASICFPALFSSRFENSFVTAGTSVALRPRQVKTCVAQFKTDRTHRGHPGNSNRAASGATVVAHQANHRPAGVPPPAIRAVFQKV